MKPLLHEDEDEDEDEVPAAEDDGTIIRPSAPVDPGRWDYPVGWDYPLDPMPIHAVTLSA